MKVGLSREDELCGTKLIDGVNQIYTGLTQIRLFLVVRNTANTLLEWVCHHLRGTVEQLLLTLSSVCTFKLLLFYA